MKKFQASATIDASPQTVWEILMNTKDYPEWDPYCERIEGTVSLGGTIKAYSTLSPGRAFPVKVATLDAPQKMVWTAGMPLGLFKGVRTFTLKQTPEGGTDFHVQEIFSGPMMILIGRTLPDLSDPFEKFAEGLKARAES